LAAEKLSKSKQMHPFVIQNTLVSFLQRFLLLVSLIILIFSSSRLFAQEIEAPDLDSVYLEARQLMGSYQYDAALKKLSTCYRYAPDVIDYALQIGYCHYQLGRYTDAKLFFNEVLKQDSLQATALSSLGGIHEREINYQKALEYYLRLIEVDSTNSYYYKLCGLTAKKLNQPLVTLGFFSRAHQYNPGDIEAIDQITFIYLSMDQLDYAEQMLQKGLSIAPHNNKLLRNKARLANKRQHFPIVAEALEQTMEQGDTTNYYQMMLGVAYIRLDSFERARYHFERLLARGEDTEHVHHYLGLAYQKQEDFEQAQKHMEIALEKAISPKIGRYHADLAKVLESQDDLSTALEHYQEAWARSDDAEDLFHLARCCDKYYADKSIALRYYEQYLASNDKKFRKYTEERVGYLKEYVHLRK
jgi:tetratricopeptide (TPR) repeat protein